VLALSAGVCLLATLVVGVIPAFQTRKLDLAGALKADSAGVVAGAGRAWVRSGLVLVQVSLSFVLLVGAGLLMQSLQKIRTSSPGFFDARSAGDGRPPGVGRIRCAARAEFPRTSCWSGVKALPGVESAAFGRMTPLSYGSFSETPVCRRWLSTSARRAAHRAIQRSGPGLLRDDGDPLVSGREFTRADDEKAALVLVVNENDDGSVLAWQKSDWRAVLVKGRWMQVVGVARDSKYESVRETPKPFFYVPLRQNFSRGQICLSEPR